MRIKTVKCDNGYCTGLCSLERECGAYVCINCNTHVGLERCYCGWSRHGEDGRKELEDMGETIGAEIAYDPQPGDDEPMNDAGVSLGDLARDAKDPHDIYS